MTSAASVLVDDVATASTDPVVSDPYVPDARSVTSTFVVHSSAVAGTAALEAHIGGAAGWVPVVSGEAVTAGQGKAIVVDLPVTRLRVRFTPDAPDASVLRVIAGSSAAA